MHPHLWYFSAFRVTRMSRPEPGSFSGRAQPPILSAPTPLGSRRPRPAAECSFRGAVPQHGLSTDSTIRA